MPIAQQDLPWMIFAWYHPDDVDFQGSDQDYLYVDTHGNFGPRPWPFMFTMLMLYVNIAAKAKGISVPPAFIDDNIHCSTMPDLLRMTPAYYAHLKLAGLSDKLEKRELIQFAGDLLGVWFCSISMTMSIPQDKVVRLTATMQAMIDTPKANVKDMHEMLGYWEFCSALLPKLMRGNASDQNCSNKNTDASNGYRRQLAKASKQSWNFYQQ